MDDALAAEILTGEGDEIADLKANLNVLEGFIKLARELDALPEVGKRFYEESRSLYQATCTNRTLSDLETLLAGFFGPPAKPAGKPLSRKLRKNSSVRYLGGIETNQSLFLLPLKSGEFYGALWPWRRNTAKVEIHLGFCSDWMVDEHYQQLEALVKRSLSQSAFQHIDTDVGGQIRGISLPSFLQMSEMEQSTYSLNIMANGKSGRLYINEGQLIAAETDEWSGREAAYRIISWEDVIIEIAPPDLSKGDEVQQPLMHVLMESLKIKDELGIPADEKPPAPPPRGALPIGGHRRLVRLERAPLPKKKPRQLRFSAVFAIFVGILVVGGSGGILTLHILNTRAETSNYKNLLDQLTSTHDEAKKIEILNHYLKTTPNTPYQSQIENKIETARKHIEENAFEQATLKISTLPVDEHYERETIAIYSNFLEQYPKSRFVAQINKSIAEIKTLMDQYYYEELKRAARLDFSERLKAYEQYLKRFPEGRYQRDVKTLIEEMGRQYLSYLKSENAACDKNRRWEPCIRKYENFAEIYKDPPLAQEAEAAIAALKDARELYQLEKQRRILGNDYQKIYETYQSYLAANPQSTRRKELEAELTQLKKKLDTQREWQTVQAYATNPGVGLFERIQQLDAYVRNNISGPYAGDAQDLMDQLEVERQFALRQQRLNTQKQKEQARIQHEKEQRAVRAQRMKQIQGRLEDQLAGLTRFRSNRNGSYSDTATGLTWTLLDSQQMIGGCLDYPAALQYVKNLSVGGHTDWRLPSANELATLYKQSPFFPRGDAQWYWSSDAYAKGFHSLADVVTPIPETLFKRQERRQDDCGAVRAVRP